MALTESNPFPLGRIAPDFNLLDTVSGRFLSLSSLKGENGTVIMFICNHCPFVLHVNEELVRLAKDYMDKGIGIIAISSNSIKTHPQDGPEKMAIHAQDYGYTFPYLYDETQEIAQAYDATCTPDFYIFDKDLKAVYHGQLDSSRPGNEIAVTGEDMRRALDHLLSGNEPVEIQKPSIGCSIKWD
jgi:peroxiredoxin